MTLLVNGLVRSVQDEELRRQHVWVGKVLAPQSNLEGCLKTLIENTQVFKFFLFSITYLT
jgi:hypothetical protein